jgi:type II secretory pathway component PulF
MPSFSYVARDSVTGREIRSSVDASSEATAVAALFNRNMLVVSISEKIGKKGRTAGGKVVVRSGHFHPAIVHHD